MECPTCFSQIEDNSSTCTYCGSKIHPQTNSAENTSGDKQLPTSNIGPVMKVQNVTSYIAIGFILVVEIGLFTFGIERGLPLYVPVPILALTVLGAAYTVRRNRKMYDALQNSSKERYTELEKKKYSNAKPVVAGNSSLIGEGSFSLETDESIELLVSPVYNNHISRSGLRVVSVDRYTENTIIVTDRRLVFLTAPVQGQGMMINGASIDMWNDIAIRNKVRGQSESLQKQLSDGGQVEHYPNDYTVDRNELTGAEYVKVVGPMKSLYSGFIRFDLESGKKLSYWVIMQPDLEALITKFNARKKHIMA